MAGIRSIVAGFVVGSAIMALPANAQSFASTSLTHTVVVTVPARVKVQVASLAASSPASIKASASDLNTVGLALTVSATHAWVLSIGSASDVTTRTPGVQWSRDGHAQFSAVTSKSTPIAAGVSSFDAKAANVFFRSANRNRDGEPVMLTVTAP
jgi:hypothetical protein